MGVKKFFGNINYLIKYNLQRQREEYSNTMEAVMSSMFCVYSKDYDIFVIPCLGLGETTVAAGYMKAWKNIHRKKIMLLAVGASRKTVFDLYDSVDVVYSINNDTYCRIRDINSDNVFCIKDPYLVLEGKRDSIYTLFKDYFNLPQNSEYDTITIKQDKIEKAEELFNSLGLKRNKTIFCIPQANCLGSDIVSNSFWEKLAQRQNKLGGDVIFNSDSEVVKGKKSVFLDLDIIIPFVNLCGKIVSVRTGLLDFIATNDADIDITAMYPDKNNQIWKKNPAILEYMYKCFYTSDIDFVEQYVKLSTLKGDFYKAKNVKEFIAQKNNEDEILDKIFG